MILGFTDGPYLVFLDVGWALKAVHDTVEASASVEVSPGRVRTEVPPDFILPTGGINLRWPDTPQAQEIRLHEYKLPAVTAFTQHVIR